MTEQPEALRLADELHDWGVTYASNFGMQRMLTGAAAELRRLHAENEDHIQQLRKEQLEVERMHRVNAQLLEALESMVASCWSDGFTNRKYNSDEHEENVRRDLVLAAIAAAKEKV